MPSLKTSYNFSLTKIASIILLYFLFSSIPAFSQDYIFDVETINVEDGLPHRNAFDIVQDKDGFIWVSTIGAIGRYDGYTFKTYTHSFLNILESSTAYLAIDRDNRLWYHERGSYGSATGSGVIDIRKDTVYAAEMISEGRFSDDDILLVANSRVNSNDIFIVTRPGIIYKYNGHFEEIYRFSHPVSHPIACEASPDGSYWIFYDQEIIHVKDKKTVRSISLPGEVSWVNEIISSSSGLIVEADPTGGYWRLEKGAFVPFVLEERPRNRN